MIEGDAKMIEGDAKELVAVLWSRRLAYVLLVTASGATAVVSAMRVQWAGAARLMHCTIPATMGREGDHP